LLVYKIWRFSAFFSLVAISNPGRTPTHVQKVKK
jgi:hypothetical protein